MNAIAVIDRVVYDAIAQRQAYVTKMWSEPSLSTDLVKLTYGVNEEVEGEWEVKYHFYQMSRDLFESMACGECYIERLDLKEAIISYFTSDETKEERRAKLEANLEEAIIEEDYERAAEIRDMLNKS